MCGIAGIINFQNKAVRKQDLENMLSKIKYRGPDDEGYFTDENAGLGFVRLSIIDLTDAGHQPKVSADGRYVIVFNGEIFNYIELREELIKEGVKFNTQSDTEVLLNAYIKWGEACLHKFNGMWAFAIFDKQLKKLFISRDRYGIKPFYYIEQPGQFVFCSEIPPLLKYLNKVEANGQNILDYLVFNRTDQSETTFFNGIKKLQHGHNLKVENGKVTISEWYNLRERIKTEKGFQSPGEFKDEFVEAVKLRLRSDVPVGVCMSGGLDSSSIVSITTDILNVKGLNSFSSVYEKGQKGDETEFIKQYENKIPHMHYVTPSGTTLKDDLNDFIRIHAEPLPSTSPYAQYKVMKLAKGKVVVILDGQGADEHLAGYHYFFGFNFKHLFKSFRWLTLVKEMFYYFKIHRSIYAFKTFIYFLLPKSLKLTARLNEKNYLTKEFSDRYSDKNSITENLYGSSNLQEALLDHFEYKLEHLLKWQDRNSMCFSLEIRSPFLDYRLVERSLATSSDWKIKNGTTKFILRESMKGIMPEKIRMRQDKIGFGTPEDEWFREKEWQEIIHEVLNSDSFAKRNIINVSNAKSQYQQHLNRKINIGKEIWKWVHLELWFREFIDKPQAK